MTPKEFIFKIDALREDWATVPSPPAEAQEAWEAADEKLDALKTILGGLSDQWLPPV